MRVKSILATVHSLHCKSQIICVLGELTNRHLFHVIFLTEELIPASSWALILCSLSLLERDLKLLRAMELYTHAPTPSSLPWTGPGLPLTRSLRFCFSELCHPPPGLIRDAHLCPTPGLLNHKLPGVEPSSMCWQVTPIRQASVWGPALQDGVLLLLTPSLEYSLEFLA